MASWLIDLVGDIGIKILAAIVIAIVFVKQYQFTELKPNRTERICLEDKKIPYQIGAATQEHYLES